MAAILQGDTVMAASPGAAALLQEKPEIIFNVLPPSVGKSFLVLLIFMCLCLGATVMELFNHIRFDIQLMRKPGWTQPAKLTSRLAYLACRYLSVVCLLLVVLFLTLKFDNCKGMPEAFNILGMFLLDAVMLVFVQRTMALYGWNPKIVVPLTLYYCLVLAMAAVCIPFYGVGYRIPGTQFCAYDTKRHVPKTLIINITYKSLGMGLDIVLLLLTLHRLLDGGLGAIRNKKPKQLYSGLQDRSLSSFLIRQGFHFYCLQLFTDIFFVTTYLKFEDVSYQVLGTALIFCIPPIAAASAFREMGKKAHLITNKNHNHVNEIMNSTGSPSGNNSGARRPSAPGALSGAASNPTNSNHIGVNSYVLQARSNPGGTVSSNAPEKTTRISWGGRRTHHHNSFTPTRSRNDNADLENNGILVTIGTVSRTEEVEADWDGGSPRYSSDVADPDTLEMQRQWPRLAVKSPHSSAAGDDSAMRSSEGHSITEKEGVNFESVQVPTLARRPTMQDNPYLSHLSPSTETNSSPWIPQTPESPYPPHLLSPSQFSRHPMSPDTARSNSLSRQPQQERVEEEDETPWRAI